MVEEKISYSVLPLTSVVVSVEPLISVTDVVEAIDSSVDVETVVSVGPLSDVSSVMVLPVNASVVVSDASVVEPVDPDSSSSAITLGGGVTSSLGSFLIISSFGDVTTVVSVSLDSVVLTGMVLASVVLSLVDESVVVSTVEDSEVDGDSSDVSVVIIVVLYSVVLADVGCSVDVDCASVVLEESEKKSSDVVCK